MSHNILYTDLAVIGGSASGLTAAIEAYKVSNGKYKITIIEKLPRIGKKLLSTGNGRCNLSNINISDEFYHTSFKHYKNVFENFEGAESFFNSLGLMCKTDEAGRIYPLSNNAGSVLDALRLYIDTNSIQTICDCLITDILKSNNIFELVSDNTIIKAKKVIIASGGYSTPSMGSDGTITRILRNLGHTVITPVPSLTPIKTNPLLVKALKGVRVEAEVSAEVNKEIIKSEKGEVQFAEGTLSGICIFNISRFAGIYGSDMKVILNLMPDITYNQLFDILKNIRTIRSHYLMEDFLTGLFHKRIGQALLKQCVSPPLTQETVTISDLELHKLCQLIQHWEFPVTGVSGWNNSQVTAGGINGKEINADLQSTIIPNLYLCGEIIDIDGDCGGYNLNWAWASGSFAGINAVR